MGTLHKFLNLRDQKLTLIPSSHHQRQPSCQTKVQLAVVSVALLRSHIHSFNNLLLCNPGHPMFCITKKCPRIVSIVSNSTGTEHHRSVLSAALRLLLVILLYDSCVGVFTSFYSCQATLLLTCCILVFQCNNQSKRLSQCRLLIPIP